MNREAPCFFPPPETYTVGIPFSRFNQVYARQKRSNWCWAAVTQMQLNYYGIPASQEEIVRRVYFLPVDQPVPITEVLSLLSGISYDRRGRPHLLCSSDRVTPAQLIEDLGNEKPLLVSLSTNGPVSHLCVITSVTFSFDAFGDLIFHSARIYNPEPAPYAIEDLSWSELTSRLRFFVRVSVLPIWRWQY